MHRSPHRLHGIPLALLVAIGCGIQGLATAAPDCPTSNLSLSTAASYTTSAASLDSSYLENRLQFDLVAGTLGLDYCCSLAPTVMYVRDTYDVTGVPAGTPVSLMVDVPVSGEIYDAGGCGGSGCAGSFRATIVHGTESAQYLYLSPALYYGARSPFSGAVRLPLTIVAGQPEVVGFEFWARRAPGGSHGAHARGQIQFSGLPGSVSIVSCQGYLAHPTPVRRNSWGALKAVYR